VLRLVAALRSPQAIAERLKFPVTPFNRNFSRNENKAATSRRTPNSRLPLKNRDANFPQLFHQQTLSEVFDL
jgi:hypothetical protein